MLHICKCCVVFILLAKQVQVLLLLLLLMMMMITDVCDAARDGRDNDMPAGRGYSVRTSSTDNYSCRPNSADWSPDL